MARIGIAMPEAFVIGFQGLEYSMIKLSAGFACERIQEASHLASDVLALAAICGAWVSALHWVALSHLLHKTRRRKSKRSLD